MKIQFGNTSSKTKYTIYYLLKGHKKKKIFRSFDKKNIKSKYEELLSKKVRLLEVWSSPSGVWMHRIAYHCPKYFIDNTGQTKGIIREKGSESLDFNRKQKQ